MTTADRLEVYRRLAPFGIEELVTAANGLLGQEEVGRRTVRFYVEQGLLKPPQGPSRAARYDYEALVRLVAYRLLGVEGIPLGEAASRVGDWLRDGREGEEIEARLDAPPSLSLGAPLAEAPSLVMESPMRFASGPQRMVRYELSEGTLDLPDDGRPFGPRLLRLAMEIERLGRVA